LFGLFIQSASVFYPRTTRRIAVAYLHIRAEDLFGIF